MPYIGTYAAAKIGYLGKQYVLWTSQTTQDGGPTASQGDADAAGVGPWVTAVTAQLNGTTVNQVSVSLEMPFRAGIKFLESGLLTNGNYLAVRVGYLKDGWMSPWFTGRMAGPSVTIDASGVSLTISAQGAGGEALLTSSGRSWGPMSRWDIIKKLADEHKVEVYDKDGSAEAKLSQQTNFSAQQSGANDWIFMRRICEEVGVRILGGINPETNRACFRLVDLTTAFGAEPVRTFVAMGNFDTSKNRYPILSFAIETPPGTLFTDAAMKGARLLAVDEFGELVEEGATTKDLPDQATAEGSMDDSDDATEADPDTGLPNGGSPDKGGADDEGAGVIITDAPEGANKDFVYSTLQAGQMGFPATQVTITVPGIPNAQCYELFKVEGLGAMFDGLYLTLDVQHSVSSSGFDTTIKAVRNAIGFAKIQTTNQNKTAPAEDGEAVGA
jgi:hypothetical protein